MDDLQQQIRERMRPVGGAPPRRTSPVAAPVRKLNPMRCEEPAGLRREVRRLNEDLALVLARAKQGQERLTRMLHHQTLCRDAECDLLHVLARLEGLRIQAAHTAVFVQRLLQEVAADGEGTLDRPRR